MLAAYCWPQSGRAGAKIQIAASSSLEDCSLTVSRVGASEEVVLDALLGALSEQPVPDDVAENGCRWESSYELTIDDRWASGFYLVRLATSEESAEAFFVVRPTQPPTSTDAALLVLSTSTWAAYNDWGGPSFYTGGHRSSQQRPLPKGFLDKADPARHRVAMVGDLERSEVIDYFRHHSYWSMAAGWANWERLFVAWAEENGVTLDYATSLDLAEDPAILDGYHTYVSVGHDEYWSASMRDHVEDWVEAGGNAVFLSGNTAFWQVRFEDTQVVGYKNDFTLDPVMGTSEQHTVSTMWSDPLCGRPESEMTGVTFSRGGYAHMANAPRGSGGYTVWRPEHWAFDGLDLRAGDLVGAEPVVVGYECDGCELQIVEGRPVATGSHGTPANFEVLGTAPAHLWATEEGAPGLPDSYIGELNWVAERLGGADTAEQRERFAYGHAVMGAFERGAGHVFTAGCTDWAYGLLDPVISRITLNLLARPRPVA